MSNFMKICPVEAELFYADGQTDMTKLIVTFCNFAKAPKNDGSLAENRISLFSLFYFYYNLRKIHLNVACCFIIFPFSILPLL
jgi:hypothetical protein